MSYLDTHLNPVVNSALDLQKKVIYLLIRKGYMKDRTQFCNHKIESCYVNALDGFYRNFSYGFMIKAVFALLFGLKGYLSNSKRGFKQAIIDLFSPESISFCTFLGGFSGIYKAALCTLRRLRGKDDGIGALISGLLAAISLYSDHSFQRRKFIVLYLFCRALDCLVQVLAKKGYIKKIRYFEVYLF